MPQSEQLLFPIESNETPQGHAPFMDVSCRRGCSLLKVERAGGVHGARAQQRAGAAPAIRHGFEGYRARRAARGPAIDTAEVVERLIRFGRTTAVTHNRLQRGCCPGGDSLYKSRSSVVRFKKLSKLAISYLIWVEIDSLKSVPGWVLSDLDS